MMRSFQVMSKRDRIDEVGWGKTSDGVSLGDFAIPDDPLEFFHDEGTDEH
jgi:hypothetical protein